MLTEKRCLRYTFLFLFFLFPVFNALAQEMQLELGPDEVAENEAFSISLIIRNGSLKSYSDFPEIPGFRKGGIQTSQNSSWVNGQSSSEIRLTQTYAPLRQGSFTLAPFELVVNGFTLKSPGKTIQVTAPSARQQPQRRQRSRPFGNDPFDQIFGDSPFDDEETEFVEIEDDAFLALTVDKSSVYVGEGFTVTLALYISEDNRAPLNFYDLSSQLNELVKKIKPANSWEESFDIQNIQREDVTIKGKRYGQYKLYKARFYPLNAELIEFPSLELTMIKYKVARRPSFFGPQKQEAYKTYKSQPKSVSVKPLPPHPLREKVAVGDYQLREQLSEETVQTGNSFSYQMTIVGQGNIAAIREPQNRSDASMTVYEPNVTQNTRKQGNTLIGAKQFSYYAIPNEPGTYDLGKYFQWIYFNPRLASYDTLRSTLTITAQGESLRDAAVLSSDLGTFYDRIETADNDLQSSDGQNRLLLLTNIFILIMLGATAWLIFKK